jgi:hypothetical protein
MSKGKTRDYRVRADGWVAGRRRKEGDIVTLTPRAARYENVEPAKPAKEAQDSPVKPTASKKPVASKE